MKIEKMGILGAGIMGAGIAQVASMSGYKVVVRDIKREFLNFGKSKFENSINRMLEKEKMDEKRAQKIVSAVEWTTELEVLSGVGLLIEAVPEDVEMKKAAYQSAEEFLPEGAIIASNTSAISISLLQSFVSDPTMFVGMHWFNPAIVMKLIEIVKGVQTSKETVGTIEEISKSMGKESIVCLDSQGFVVSRAGLALVAECYRIYEEGIASKEDIDKGLRLGLGHPMGAFELSDFTGLETQVTAYKGLEEIYGDRFRPSQRLRNLVRAGRTGRKSKHGWYDYDKQ